MKFIVDFYKGLDAVNLLIFWGVIIVVLLLLIFAIIITNKNRKLEKILAKSGIDVDDFNDDGLAIKKVIENDIPAEPVKEESTLEITENEEDEQVNIAPVAHIEESTKEELTMPEPEIKEIPKEEKFVAEEHVMEYQTNIIKEAPIKEETYETNNAYQKNVLKDYSSNQTSPIGISRNNENDAYKAAELHNALNESNVEKRNYQQDETLVNQKKYADSYNQVTRKGDYLTELSKKLSSANDVDRTDYEIKQEEDAIISYEELMQKKDSIKTIDEEDAIISIEELRKRKQEEDKLYNITKDEEDDEFINELKHFRSDL